MNATYYKNTIMLVVVNKPMCPTDNFKPLISVYELDRNYINLKEKNK